MRLPRTTGVLSGTLIVVLGAWAALIPFIGPYFHYSIGSTQSWHFSTARLWFDVVPGIVAIVGGLMMIRAAHRASGTLGGWLAMAAGMWLVIGTPISLLWQSKTGGIGAPVGGHARQAIELVGYFYGAGALILALAAFATGRFVSRPRIAEEVGGVGAAAAVETERAATRRGRFTRRRPAEEPVAEERTAPMR